MFGRLSIEDIPFNNPVIMGAVYSSTLAALAIIILITYYKKWTYLWTEWLTSVDHKKIGIMYIILALVMMMRVQQAMAAGDAMGFLPAHHFDQIFGSHGTIMIVFVAMPFLTGLMNII